MASPTIPKLVITGSDSVAPKVAFSSGTVKPRELRTNLSVLDRKLCVNSKSRDMVFISDESVSGNAFNQSNVSDERGTVIGN